MNTANLDLTANPAFQGSTQIIQPQPQARKRPSHPPRTRKKVRVSLRKKDTSRRDKWIGIIMIAIIVGLFVGALGFTAYHMAKGNSAPEATAGY